MKALFVFLSLSLSFSSFGQQIFKITKDKRSKNILHFYAVVENCKFKAPSMKNHWIMGEERNQIEGLTPKEKPHFSPKITYSKDTEVSFTMGAIEKLGNKVPNKEVQVRLEKCKPVAYFEINGKEIKLSEIFVNTNIMMLPTDITIKGTAADGSAFSYKIK